MKVVLIVLGCMVLLLIEGIIAISLLEYIKRMINNIRFVLYDLSKERTLRKIQELFIYLLGLAILLLISSLIVYAIYNTIIGTYFK